MYKHIITLITRVSKRNILKGMGSVWICLLVGHFMKGDRKRKEETRGNGGMNLLIYKKEGIRKCPRGKKY